MLLTRILLSEIPARSAIPSGIAIPSRIAIPSGIVIPMRIALNVLGVLFLLMGCVWFLQGINILPGSFMTGQTKWAVYGGQAKTGTETATRK